MLQIKLQIRKVVAGKLENRTIGGLVVIELPVLNGTLTNTWVYDDDSDQPWCESCPVMLLIRVCTPLKCVLD